MSENQWGRKGDYSISWEKNPWDGKGSYKGQNIPKVAPQNKKKTVSIELPNDVTSKKLAALIYAEADASPYKDDGQVTYTEEMLAIGSVIRNRIEWVKNYPSDKDSFCSADYIDVMKCVNKWKQRQFLSYNSKRYNKFLKNGFPDAIEAKCAKACITAAIKIINDPTSPYPDYLGFNQSNSQSPFSKDRTITPPDKIGVHYFWKLQAP